MSQPLNIGCKKKKGAKSWNASLCDKLKWVGQASSILCSNQIPYFSPHCSVLTATMISISKHILQPSDADNSKIQSKTVHSTECSISNESEADNKTGLLVNADSKHRKRYYEIMQWSATNKVLRVFTVQSCSVRFLEEHNFETNLLNSASKMIDELGIN